MDSRQMALVVVALIVGVASEAVAQSPWPFQLHWEHDGANVTHFEVCVDGRCEPAGAARLPNSSTWTASVPSMPEGEHRVVVRACNGGACTSGEPDLFVRVLPVSTGPSRPAPAPPSKSKPRRVGSTRQPLSR